MDNFTIIYKILSALEKALDYDQCNPDMISADHLGITENRWKHYMIMLYEAGYIEGLKASRYIDDSVLVDVRNIRITLKGLEYLSENTTMKKAFKIAKGVADIIP